ncbi:CoA transferase [Novosphingobium sp. BL-8A]|uniref:CoA transferase n=1 Tax=Novosphingobium sp. BL-8A TaxID=3127639 RepID=UPI003757F8F2
MPTDAETVGPAIPLARWADRQLEALARDFALPRLAGAALLGERAAHGDYRIAGCVSAGLGGSRLMPTCDNNSFALTLIREIDRELLPALFGDADLDTHDAAAIAAAVLRSDGNALLETGRLLGLPVALLDEVPTSPPIEVIARGPHRERPIAHRPLVVDLSAIWAGPLAGHLLWLAGMEVVKVESRTRPDLIRRDDPATFDLINQGKASVLVDFASRAEKARLVELIRQADVVIESSRPRALRHLGIDAEALVREVPGLVWLSVTGHGAQGNPADWVGIGNDCGVAGGLSRALAEAIGKPGYVGDAIADPLTGITGAREVLKALHEGEARRIGLSMSAITAMALDEEQAFDAELLNAELRAWGESIGHRFPALERRAMTAPVSPIGADTARYLSELTPC